MPLKASKILVGLGASVNLRTQVERESGRVRHLQQWGLACKKVPPEDGLAEVERVEFMQVIVEAGLGHPSAIALTV